jgi:hypothetical protein
MLGSTDTLNKTENIRLRALDCNLGLDIYLRVSNENTLCSTRLGGFLIIETKNTEQILADETQDISNKSFY